MSDKFEPNTEPSLDELRAMCMEIADKIVKKVGKRHLYVCIDKADLYSRSYRVDGYSKQPNLTGNERCPPSRPGLLVLNGQDFDANERELRTFLLDIQNGLLDKIDRALAKFDAESAKTEAEEKQFKWPHLQGAIKKAASWE